MLEETVRHWLLEPEGCYIDGTFGRGGHSKELLKHLNESGRLLAFDRDSEAVNAAKQIALEDRRFSICHGDFANMKSIVKEQGWVGEVSGILLDLGVSSPQLDQAERGFSFMREGPLDMRMDTSRGESAAEWLARADESEIAKVLWEFGEERYARKIANAIVEGRQKNLLVTTSDLVDLIESVVKQKERGKHKATRSFQAIRIYINQELQQLQDVLEDCEELLAVGGRLVVISFHSLEDRIVKRYMRDMASGDKLPSYVPVRDSQLNRKFRIIVRGEKASEKEVIDNPRARSAILRVAEKIE